MMKLDVGMLDTLVSSFEALDYDDNGFLDVGVEVCRLIYTLHRS